MGVSRLVAVGGVLLAGAVLVACAETEFAVHAAKTIAGLEDEASATGEGRFKVGDPYEVEGVWYYPEVDATYDKTGIASWYGEPFHGRRTANGEIYDMNEMTAAHKTLPLPTFVRVTNLENGRSIVVRVNDRGPFVHGRIIDMSRRAAQLLGFELAGTAKVRVGVLASDEQEPETRLAMLDQLGGEIVVADASGATGGDVVVSVGEPSMEAVPVGDVTVVSLDAPMSTDAVISSPASESTVVIAASPEMYIQVGAFANSSNATALEQQLSDLGTTRISQLQIDEQILYRVRLGPFDSLDQADATLEQLIAIGHPQARLIVD